MQFKYTTFTDVVQLDAAIAASIASAVTLREGIQDVAVGILCHAVKHGDWTRAEAYVLGLGGGVHQRALVEWFAEFGGLIVGQGADGRTGFIAWSGRDYIRDHFERAKETGWWTFKPAKPFSGFDLSKEFERLVQRADKAMREREKLAKSGHAEDAAKVVIDVDALTRLKAAMAAKVA